MFLNLYFILDETWHFVKLNNEGGGIQKEKKNNLSMKVTRPWSAFPE